MPHNSPLRYLWRPATCAEPYRILSALQKLAVTGHDNNRHVVVCVVQLFAEAVPAARLACDTSSYLTLQQCVGAASYTRGVARGHDERVSAATSLLDVPVSPLSRHGESQVASGYAGPDRAERHPRTWVPGLSLSLSQLLDASACAPETPPLASSERKSPGSWTRIVTSSTSSAPMRASASPCRRPAT